MYTKKSSPDIRDEFIRKVAHRADCEDQERTEIATAAFFYFSRLFLSARVEDLLLSSLPESVRRLASVPRHQTHEQMNDFSELENRNDMLRNIMRESSLHDTAQALRICRAVCAGIIELTSPSVSYAVRQCLPRSLREIWIESLYHFELQSLARESFLAEVENYTGLTDRDCIDETAKTVLEAMIASLPSAAKEMLFPFLPEEYRVSLEARLFNDTQPQGSGEVMNTILIDEQPASAEEAQKLIGGIFHGVKLAMGGAGRDFGSCLSNEWKDLWDGVG